MTSVLWTKETNIRPLPNMWWNQAWWTEDHQQLGLFQLTLCLLQQCPTPHSPTQEDQNDGGQIRSFHDNNRHWQGTVSLPMLLVNLNQCWQWAFLNEFQTHKRLKRTLILLPYCPNHIRVLFNRFCAFGYLFFDLLFLFLFLGRTSKRSQLRAETGLETIKL